MAEGWAWDSSLYSGSAPYYVTGRLPYPPDVAEALHRELALDGTGGLLDVGCGPGSLTLLLADQFETVVGVDADPGMIAEAERRGRQIGRRKVRWVRMRAESLPAGLGTFRVVTLAQSFHWMDRAQVATLLLSMLEPGGALVHVGATTHRGASNADDLPGPTPPRDRVHDLVVSYLGTDRRAGQGTLPGGTASDEDGVLAATGFVGPRRLQVGGGEIVARSEDQIVASVFSLSSAAPHLFGDRVGAFERDLRALLRDVSPSGEFWERTESVGLSIWGKPDEFSTPPLSVDP